MSRHVVRTLALCAAVLASIYVHAAALRTKAFPTPDPNAAPQTAMPATLCTGNPGMAGPYPCKNVDLQAFMPLNSLGCGSAAVVWGWTDTSTQKEYALLACNTGTSFVDISNPAVPIYLGRLPGHSANSSWRDVKVYQHYAYVGSEASGHGIQVFDLHRLRNVPSPPATFTEDAWYGQVLRTHTLWINEQTGFLYASGSAEGPQNCGGDLHMVNLANPLAPVSAGCVGLNGYVHEAQCLTYTGPDTAYQGREICFTSNGRFDNTDTLGIDDVTNKSAVQQLARVGYPSPGYAHQTYTTEDQQYMLMDDEFDEQDLGFNSRTLIWDIRDLNNPVYMGHFLSTSPAIDHNQYIRGSYAFQSNYRAGLRILDLKNIATASLSEYGYFDIYPANDLAEFNGNWCNYPFYPSGNVVLSGIEQGLFIVKPKLLPKVSVNDVTVPEGNSGTSSVTFTITLSAASTQNVSVNYSTSNGTATAGSPGAGDYPSGSGTILIPAGTTTKTKEIGVFGDTDLEGDETFFINLSSVVNAELQDAQGMATIIDDDASVPTISVNDIAINEGDEDTVTATLTLTVTPAETENVSVQWNTADGTAQEGEDDYVAASGTAVFTNGVATIDITINGDMMIEDNEVFVVELTNPIGAVLARSEAEVGITNDDVLTFTSVSPSSGSSSGGTTITVTGTRFEDGIMVHFNQAYATDVTVIDDEHLTAVTPELPPATLVPLHAHYMMMSPTTPPMHLGALLFFSDFLDVPAAHPFHDDIEKLVRGGITGGCGSSSYCPTASVNRAQMAMFLLKSKFGSTYPVPPAAGIFSDVPAESPFAPWIEDLYNRGITSGCGTSPLRYCPSTPITRAQMAVFLLRTEEGSAYQPPPATGTMFNDVPANHVFAAWIEELARRGVTSGCGGGNYCLNDPARRDQMATFLVRTFGLQ